MSAAATCRVFTAYLDYTAVSHHDNLVIPRDGTQSVSHRQYRHFSIPTFLLQHLLNEIVRLLIHRGCGFIQNDDFWATYQSSDQSHCEVSWHWETKKSLTYVAALRLCSDLRLSHLVHCRVQTLQRTHAHRASWSFFRWLYRYLHLDIAQEGPSWLEPIPVLAMVPGG